uniref:Uncharacterized protein n=1 Tax=Parascaris univalens TaxID=6257 RepID=A0A914ZMS8_PARUN
SYLLLQHSVESSIDSYIICCVSEQKLMIDSICQDSRNFDFCSFRVFRSRPLFDIAETAFFFVISSSGPLDRCVVYRSRTDEVGEKNANTAILRSERGEIESRPTLRFVSQARFQVKSFFATGERFCNRERQNVQLAQHKLLRVWLNQARCHCQLTE